MGYVFLKQQVGDYEQWRPHFDEGRGLREEIEINDIAVLRDAHEPNT